MKVGKRDQGFTIVELLIVIVVIGILAAITLIAYNGIQNRAKVSAAQSDLANAENVLENAKITSAAAGTGEIYPADPVGTGLLKPSGSSQLAYIAVNTANPPYYCLTSTNGSIVYSATSNTSGTMQGTCVTNLIPNPRLANDVVTWQNSGSIGGATVSTGRAATGGPTTGLPTFYRMSNSTAFTASPAVIATLGTGTASIAVSPNTQYTISGYQRTSCSLTGGFRFDDVEYTSTGTTLGTSGGSNTAATPNTWQRVTRTFTTGLTTAFLQLQVDFSGETACPSSPSSTFDFTGLMLIANPNGTTYANYGDGDTSGWSWTGTANASSSVGPLL